MEDRTSPSEPQQGGEASAPAGAALATTPAAHDAHDAPATHDADHSAAAATPTEPAQHQAAATAAPETAAKAAPETAAEAAPDASAKAAPEAADSHESAAGHESADGHEGAAGASAGHDAEGGVSAKADGKAEATATATPEGGAGETKDFAAILAEFEQGQSGGEGAAQAGGDAAGAAASEQGRHAAGGGVPGVPNVGQKVKGKVVSIADDKVFVDLGAKSEGMIEAAQLRDAEGNLTVSVGDAVDATVTSIDGESGLIMLRKRAGGGRGGHQEVATELRQAFQYGMPVEGMVTGINKGGAEVQVYGMRAFCPLSQLDLRYVENPQQFIGQHLKFKVARIEEGSRNRRPDIVLSRRALLEEEAQSKAAELRARLQVGAVMKGRVTSLTAYGAFIDLGGLEGLLHVSEIGYSRVADPREALTVGQEVEVQIIKIEKGKDEKRPERISLSRRALERDPWRDAAARFTEGTVLTGRVMRMESFGAFVQLAPGLEGLVHVSEMGAGRRVNHAREVVQAGQDIQVRVLNVDPVKRRISLSMALADEPHPAEEAAPRERESSGASQPPASFGALGDFFKSSSQRRK